MLTDNLSNCASDPPASNNLCRLLIFVKEPLPGNVKTRLAPYLGAAQAASLYASLIEHCVHCAQTSAVGAAILYAAPSESHEFLSELALNHRLSVQAQEGNDLGERMAHAIAASVVDGMPTLLIGSDCAALTPQYLQSAARALHSGCDVVLGPTEDGGYYLIGMRNAHPQVFQNIAWSTPAVAAQTRARLRELDLRWTELPIIWDVDRPEDLPRLRTLDAFAAWHRNITQPA